MSVKPNSVEDVERAQPLSRLRENTNERIDSDPTYFSISDLAKRWRCSRGSVYNILRGEKVLDFATPGHKGHKLVSIETVRRIEARHLRVMR